MGNVIARAHLLPEAISNTADCFVWESILLATTCQGAKFAPKFSPDGTLLAYALDLDGSESYQIVVHDFETNISTNLTPRIAYAHQPNIIMVTRRKNAGCAF